MSEKPLSIPRYATTFTGEVLERLLSRPPIKVCFACGWYKVRGPRGRLNL